MRYIYVATVDGEIVYVGIGVKDRYKHLTSGISSCYPANERHFKGLSEPEVIKVYHGTQEEVKYYERRLIEELEPTWNTIHNPRPRKRKYKFGKMEGREFHGVYAYKHKWKAWCSVNGKKKDIGYFPTSKLAARAYDAFVLLHGLDRPLNFG